MREPFKNRVAGIIALGVLSSLIASYLWNIWSGSQPTLLLHAKRISSSSSASLSPADIDAVLKAVSEKARQDCPPTATMTKQLSCFMDGGEAPPNLASPPEALTEPEFLKELKAAKQGDGRAMVAIGSRYEFGKGVRLNKRASITWYKLAAANSDPEASKEAREGLKRVDQVDFQPK